MIFKSHAHVDHLDYHDSVGWNIDDYITKLNPQENNARDMSFSFSQLEENSTNPQRKICMARTKSTRGGRESILSGKKSWGFYRTTGGVPCQALVVLNYIAVLQKGFETTFQAKWVVLLNRGHACWEFLLVGNKYYIHCWGSGGEGYSAGRHWVPIQTCTTLNTPPLQTLQKLPLVKGPNVRGQS
jgi:hypothetical protein